MHMPELEVAATCVRLPIETGHSESVYVELESNDATVEDLKSILKDAPGITLQDDPSQQIYPMPADAVGEKRRICRPHSERFGPSKRVPYVDCI
ncbi:hypothetical protein BsIDN1_30970 [Bacillus safensis]|uniref:Semialdehyde dehydrogenase dimerisation domain-containing protein n=1 Tax=Bacillus safensis TaxID=561879 RepID=A0A5S9MC12_BACIA|nr:hypothetical protein BsIDN1_30970 [Bacillus safensis]